jgi:AcrR family transcriptional regulator
MTETTRGRRQRRQREDVLAVAADLLLQRGVDRFSLRELARRTDYTPGALYNFFPGKQALLDELTERVFERFDAYLGAVSSDLPVAERLAQLSDAYMRFAEEHGEEYQLVFTRIPAPGSTSFDDADAVPRPWSHLVDACRDGAIGGDLKARSHEAARVVFFQFFALHHGLAMLRLTRMKALPPQVFEPLAEAVRADFVRGLLSRPAERGAGDTSPRPGRPGPPVAPSQTTQRTSRRSKEES